MSRSEKAEYGTAGSIDFKDNASSNGITAADITNQVHQLPCCIKFDGHSSVSHYFKPKSTGVESDGSSVEEAYFRGRKLLGSKIPVPPGYSGFVLGKRRHDDAKSAQKGEGNSNCWEVKAKFDNITYWNHDDLPSKDDTLMRSFHWFAVSNAVSHGRYLIFDRNVMRRWHSKIVIIMILKSTLFTIMMSSTLQASSKLLQNNLVFLQLHDPVTAEDLASASIDLVKN